VNVDAIDIDAELRNWAAFVHWGDDGGPEHSELCGSVEKEYADHLSRFQYESRIRPLEPRIHDGYLMERLICHPDFPVIWKRVLRVQYLYCPDAPGVWKITDTYEDKLAERARRARVSTRSYPDYLDGAKKHLLRLLAGGKPVSVEIEEPTGRLVFRGAT
jgi:hypothetical protein